MLTGGTNREKTRKHNTTTRGQKKSQGDGCPPRGGGGYKIGEIPKTGGGYMSFNGFSSEMGRAPWWQHPWKKRFQELKFTSTN